MSVKAVKNGQRNIIYKKLCFPSFTGKYHEQRKLTELPTVKMIIARRKIQLVRVKSRNEKMYCLSDRFRTKYNIEMETDM